ncbi:hypothetical protein [Clostridium botulinum]|uniref:hypothetical protein n=1 Tax=Clostridium botulinum TaxID=1491 RepID=UPI003DA3571B
MKNRSELLKIISKKKELLGILDVEGDISSLKEGIDASTVKAECKGEEDILTINSIKVMLKHKIPASIDFDANTISTILAVIILEEYNNGYLSLDENTLNKLISRLTTS